MKIISITGSKGKTTITRIISEVIHILGNNTLRVDSDGHYINEIRKSSRSDSLNLFNKRYPTVCPGKYLIAMKDFYPDFTAILETSIGSSESVGMGYDRHDIGIFTNVYFSHIDKEVKDRKSQSQLAERKSFAFSEIGKNGIAIFNADDKHVCSQLGKISDKRNITLLPVGLEFSSFNKNRHLKNGGKIITLKENYIVVDSQRETIKTVNINRVSWTFGGKYLPAIFNLMFAIGGIYAWNNGKMDKNTLSLIENYRFKSDSGRLALFKNKEGVRIIVDFAHERQSLKEIAKLGERLKKNRRKNRLIGVLRMDPSVNDDSILGTGKHIATDFEEFIIYDKFDRKNKDYFKKWPKRKVGETADILLKGILAKRKRGCAEKIIVEKEAIQRASKKARNGDVVVVIRGDDPARTIRDVKKIFNAKPTKNYAKT
jgi:cyanophycin synthetase